MDTKKPYKIESNMFFYKYIVDLLMNIDVFHVEDIEVFINKDSDLAVVKFDCRPNFVGAIESCGLNVIEA